MDIKTYKYFNRKYDSRTGSVHTTENTQRMQPLQENEAHIFQSKQKYVTMDYKRCNFYIERRDKDDKVIRIYDKDAHMELNNREWVWKEPKRDKAGEWETGWVVRKTWGLKGTRLQDLDSWKGGWLRFVAVEAKDHDDFVKERDVKMELKVDSDAKKKLEVQTSVEKITRKSEAEMGERKLERDRRNQEGRMKSREKGKESKGGEESEREKQKKRKKREKRGREKGESEKRENKGFKGLTRVLGHRSGKHRASSGGATREEI